MGQSHDKSVVSIYDLVETAGVLNRTVVAWEMV